MGKSKVDLLPSLWKGLLMDNTSKLYYTLLAQLDRLARHNRQGSYRTRQRYYEAMQRFCRFLAATFRLQKLANISTKHVVAYVQDMQDRGLAASTIKTDLAAIRFWHDKMSKPRYTLPDNDDLGIELERRRFGQADRTWDQSEFYGLCSIAEQQNRPDYVQILILGRYAGLRIHEVFRLDTAAAHHALRTGTLTVKGKGGRIRTIPVCTEVAACLSDALRNAVPGHKLFVPDDVPTDQAIYDLQDFLRRYRSDVSLDSNREVPLSFHGLRHTFAAEKYETLLAAGASPLDAHLAVSHLLGHSRPDVTNIYLASLRSSGAQA
jgi:integrase